MSEKIKVYIGDILSGYTDVMGKQEEIILVTRISEVVTIYAEDADKYCECLRFSECEYVRSDHPLFAIKPAAYESYLTNRLTNILTTSGRSV